MPKRHDSLQYPILLSNLTILFVGFFKPNRVFLLQHIEQPSFIFQLHTVVERTTNHKLKKTKPLKDTLFIILKPPKCQLKTITFLGLFDIKFQQDLKSSLCLKEMKQFSNEKAIDQIWDVHFWMS